jgi:hypothetical protein
LRLQNSLIALAIILYAIVLDLQLYSGVICGHTLIECIYNSEYTQGRIQCNGKTGKTAALSKYSDTLTLSQPEGTDYAHHISFASPKKSRDYAPEKCLARQKRTDHFIMK